jgi:SAM-dependent methyltransferase
MNSVAYHFYRIPGVVGKTWAPGDPSRVKTRFRGGSPFLARLRERRIHGVPDVRVPGLDRIRREPGWRSCGCGRTPSDEAAIAMIRSEETTAGGYREDLAAIHDAGFGALAQAAAPVLLDALRRRWADGGLVIDLGCGSGILSRQVADAGYEVLGIDISPAMIDLARSRLPRGRFRVGSLLTADLPPCIAVAAVGEVLNYTFDRSNSPGALESFFHRVHQALRPEGLLLFDAAGPGRVPGGGPRQVHAEGDGWAVLVTAEQDERAGILTRQITSFRRVGDLYRRDHEVHRLRLIRRSEVLEQLRDLGFRVRTLRAYGDLSLPPGLLGFLARKT